MVDSVEYNEDELVAPEWLDEIFFEKVLIDSENKQDIKVSEIYILRVHYKIKYFQVRSIVVNPGSKKGDHYASVMFRITVIYDTSESTSLEKRLIVKTMPTVDGAKKEFMDVSLFETEIKMYTETIPQFQKSLKDSGDDTEIGGKCVYGSLTPYPVIMFEDLTTLNYKPVSSWAGDWEITKKAVSKLAKWHALSYKSYIEEDKNPKSFRSNFFSGDKRLTFPAFANSYKNFLTTLKQHGDLFQFIPKFERLAADEPLLKIQNIYEDSRAEANLFVLNHSDFHIKNFMYLENDSGELIDVKLIDFQLCIWAPAVIDLIYMMYMCLDVESRLQRRDEIIHFYYSDFIETLNKLNFSGPVPKLTDIYKDFITFKDFGKSGKYFSKKFSFCIFFF